MTTKTTVSGAAPACPERRRAFPEGRGLIPSVNDRETVYVPLVYPQARRAPHPRKPFRVISYSSLDTEFLIETPRLEIAATTRKTNNMQNSNRDKNPGSRPLRVDRVQGDREPRPGGFSR